MLLGARQFFERRGAALPYDAEVEYLESTGTQWIDTGITPSAATECNIDLMFTGETIQQFGTGRKLSSKWAVLLGYYQYGQYGISFWAGVNQTTRRSTHIVNERVLCGFSIPNGTYWLGGNPTADANLTAPTTDCPTFALFARKNATNDLSGYCTMRVFSAEINGVEGVRDFVPAKAEPSQVRCILERLDALKPGGETDMAGVLHEIAERIPRRSVVFVVSDFFADAKELLRALHHLRFRRHEVIAIQVCDHDELTFPFERACRFEDLETRQFIDVDARALRKDYLARLGAHFAELSRGCGEMRVTHERVDTSRPFHEALADILVRYRRAAGGGR